MIHFIDWPKKHVNYAFFTIPTKYLVLNLFVLFPMNQQNESLNDIQITCFAKNKIQKYESMFHFYDDLLTLFKKWIKTWLSKKMNHQIFFPKPFFMNHIIFYPTIPTYLTIPIKYLFLIWSLILFNKLNHLFLHK